MQFGSDIDFLSASRVKNILPAVSLTDAVNLSQLNAVSSNISGNGNYIPKFLTASTIGNSRISDNGSTIDFNSYANTFPANFNISDVANYSHFGALYSSLYSFHSRGVKAANGVGGYVKSNSAAMNIDIVQIGDGTRIFAEANNSQALGATYTLPTPKLFVSNTGVAINKNSAATTALDVVGEVSILGAYAIPQLKIQSSDGDGIYIHSQGTNSHTNWLIGQQKNISGLEFTPSTALGGTTFSTPMMYLTTSGMTVNNSVNINSVGNKSYLSLYTSFSGNSKIIDVGQVNSDGYLKVNSANGTTQSYISGYVGTPNYLLAPLLINTTTDNTFQKVQVNGSISATDGFVTRNVGRTGYHDVYSYSSSANPETGTRVIEIPNASSYNNMASFVIEGYTYAFGQGYWRVEISGYNYSDSTWYNTSAQFYGNAPFSSVRLAFNSTTNKNVIMLGNITTTWYYPKFTISMRSSQGFNYASGWASDLVTTETNYININTPTVSNNFVGNITVGGLQVNGNSLITGVANFSANVISSASIRGYGLISDSYIRAFTTIDNYRSGTEGYVTMNQGSTTKSGYLAFYTPNQSRAGYIGYSSNGSVLEFYSDNSSGFDFFNGRINVNNQKITGLANGTASTDAVNFSQLNSVTTNILAANNSWTGINNWSNRHIINGLADGTNTYTQYQNANTNLAIVGSIASMIGSSPSNFGVWVYGDNNYSIYTNSTERLKITSSGIDVKNAKITNLAAATIGSDATRFDQLTWSNITSKPANILFTETGDGTNNTNTYINARVLRNSNTTTSHDGMFIGYGNTNSGFTRIFGGGATTGGIRVAGSGVNDVYIAENIAFHAGNYSSINISNFVTGTLADARLTSNIPLKNTANIFSQAQTFTNDVIVNSQIVSSISSDIGGKISIQNPSKTGDIAHNWIIYNMGGAYGNGLNFWSYNQSGVAGTGGQGRTFTIGDDGTITAQRGRMYALGFNSTVANGTAPLVVTSQTQVANLNASLLAGYTANQLGLGLFDQTLTAARTVTQSSYNLTFNQIGGASLNIDGGASGVAQMAFKVGSNASYTSSLQNDASNFYIVRNSVAGFAMNSLGNVGIGGNPSSTLGTVLRVIGNMSCAYAVSVGSLDIASRPISTTNTDVATYNSATGLVETTDAKHLPIGSYSALSVSTALSDVGSGVMRHTATIDCANYPLKSFSISLFGAQVDDVNIRITMPSNAKLGGIYTLNFYNGAPTFSIEYPSNVKKQDSSTNAGTYVCSNMFTHMFTFDGTYFIKIN